MLNGYMDGELDLVHRMEVERHMQACSECARRLHNGRAIGTALRSELLYRAAPNGMERRVLGAVHAAERSQRPSVRQFLRPAVGITAFAALLVVLCFAFAQKIGERREEALTQQVMCSHARSLMATHLLDIVSTDPHIVTSWFGSRLDYTPPVIDLTPQSYPLQGGRLDYFNDRPVSALVYRRRDHVINLFLWPTSDPTNPQMHQESRHGYRLCQWTAGGVTYWAVSDLAASELVRFAGTVQAHTSPIIVPERCE